MNAAPIASVVKNPGTRTAQSMSLWLGRAKATTVQTDKLSSAIVTAHFDLSRSLSGVSRGVFEAKQGVFEIRPLRIGYGHTPASISATEAFHLSPLKKMEIRPQNPSLRAIVGEGNYVTFENHSGTYHRLSDAYGPGAWVAGEPYTSLPVGKASSF